MKIGAKCISFCTQAKACATEYKFSPCEEGGYTANIKEMRGVISESDTIEEAMANVLDALELMLEVGRN